MSLAKNYEFNTVESEMFRLWESASVFSSDASSPAEPFTIAIPPPNVTGVLHMGHALNNTIQDVLIRLARMTGKNARWIVGTDHAGIATQNVVEKKLAKEGKTRHDLGKEAFLKEVWEWKNKHGGVIIDQLKKLGCSCDYDNERFTMDKGLALAVRQCFVKLFEAGLVYQGNRLIHWCSRCLTALSDEEAEHQGQSGKLYWIKYPLEDGSAFIEIATTRPETLLGDTAIAVNPDDERYIHLHGKKVLVPFVERLIPVISDSLVDKAFGSGMVKVTPAHDPNDYEMGERHHLDFISVFNEDGTMNENAVHFKGLNRFECRKKILTELKEKDLLIKIEDHAMSIRKCYRCDEIVEPRMSKQWFVRMKPLADEALGEYTAGNLRFQPEHFGNIYQRWLENIKDWCISRQIWWGHSVPAWHCEVCEGITVSVEDEVTNCSSCGSEKLKKDPDVLDTWFSSWLWPFSTLGWPMKTAELETFYPTQVLTTAQEIIFFWVARMVMAGKFFLGKGPFRDVFIHGTVRDDSGLKMSKSFGNVIDPLSIIEKFGADALRYSLMVNASRGNDVYISDKKFEVGRNFATKIWNAFKFIMPHLEENRESLKTPRDFESEWNAADIVLLSEVDVMIEIVRSSIQEFRFNDASIALQDFFWKTYCDRYIEAVKPSLRFKDGQYFKSVSFLYFGLIQFLKSAHAVIPFITEHLWQNLRAIDSSLGNVLARESFPDKFSWIKDKRMIDLSTEVFELIRQARHLKTLFNVPSNFKSSYFIHSLADSHDFLLKEKDLISQLIPAGSLIIDKKLKLEKQLPSNINSLGTVFMEFDSSSFDVSLEIKRIEKKITELDTFIKSVDKKLSNEGFLANAPQQVIAKEKEKREEAVIENEKMTQVLKVLTVL